MTLTLPQVGVLTSALPFYESHSNHYTEAVDAHCLVQKLDEDAQPEYLEVLCTKFKYNFTDGSRSSLEFLETVSKVSCPDILRTNIRLVIDMKWERYKPYFYAQALGYFVHILIVFLKATLWMDSIAINVILMITNSILLVYEILQMREDGWGYFLDMWNTFDFLSIVLLYVSIIFSFTPLVDHPAVIIVFAICNLLIWLRGIS